MKYIPTFLLIFLISSALTREDESSGSSSEDFDLDEFLNQLKSEQNEANDTFNQNRSNLDSLTLTLNKLTLQTNERVIKDLQANLEKIKKEQERIKASADEADSAAQQQSKDIEELLNLKPHLLFDESESDTSTIDISQDEEVEMQVAQYCTKAYVDSIPPSFCIKNPIEFGTNDISCADGDDEILGLCYEKCTGEYVSSGIVCKKSCPSGYITNPLTCFKTIFNWKFRTIIQRKWYTKYDGRAYCHAPKVKEIFMLLPKCFLDCEEINLVNCGPNSCGMTSGVCKESIKNIIKDLISGIGKLFLNVVTFGLSGLITSILSNPTAIYNAAKKAGHDAMQAAYKNVQVWMGRIDQNKLVNEMVALTTSYISKNSTLANLVNNDRIVNRCKSVRDIFYEKLVNTPEVNVEWKDFTAKDLKEYVNMCTQANAGEACKRAIRQSTLKWDPTGIVSMVSAFKQQNCTNIA